MKEKKLFAGTTAYYALRMQLNNFFNNLQNDMMLKIKSIIIFFSLTYVLIQYYAIIYVNNLHSCLSCDHYLNVHIQRVKFMLNFIMKHIEFR